MITTREIRIGPAIPDQVGLEEVGRDDPGCEPFSNDRRADLVQRQDHVIDQGHPQVDRDQGRTSPGSGPSGCSSGRGRLISSASEAALTQPSYVQRTLIIASHDPLRAGSSRRTRGQIGVSKPGIGLPHRRTAGRSSVTRAPILSAVPTTWTRPPIFGCPMTLTVARTDDRREHGRRSSARPGGRNSGRRAAGRGTRSSARTPPSQRGDRSRPDHQELGPAEQERRQPAERLSQVDVRPPRAREHRRPARPESGPPPC